MVWAIFTDREAVDLLDAAAEMAAAALAARSRRVDEDGVIKRSVDMSRIKLATLRSAFHEGPLIGLAEFTQDELSQFHALAEIVRTSENAHEQEAAFKAMRSLMLRPGPQEPSTLGSDPWGDDDLPKPAIRGGEGKAASRKAGVRKVRRKASD